MLAAILVAGSAAAEVAVSERRSISVSGQGEASAAPDIATVNAGVQALAPTAIEAAKQNEALVSQVMAALKKQRIADKDIRTADYSIFSERRRDPRDNGETTITGYRVSNSVQVTVRDLDTLGDVLGAVTNAGANAVNGIEFGIDDGTALEARARAAAMADARSQAEALAKLAGVELGDVLQISLSSGGGYPRPVAMARMAMADAAPAPAPSVSAGELNVSVNVQVIYAIH